jgi:hypothetical protein
MKRVGMFAFFFLLGISTVWADATIEAIIKSSGFKGLGSFEGRTTKKIQGEKMWEQSATHFTGAILSRVASGRETVHISRIDKGVYWTLDPKDKTYFERPIEAFPKGDPEKEKPEQEKPRVRVTKSEFSVKKTGASEVINGFPCEEYLLTWLLEMEDLETKAKSVSTMTNHLWTTPETAGIRMVQAEEMSFGKALAKKMGLQISPQETQKMGFETFMAMTGTSPEDAEKGFIRIREETAKIKGYTIRSVSNWSLDGEKSPTLEKTGKEGTSPTDRLKSVGGFLSGLSKEITQKVIGEKGVTPSDKEGGTFSTTYEVKAISSEPVPREVFEIPEGFKKTKK